MPARPSRWFWRRFRPDRERGSISWSEEKGKFKSSYAGLTRVSIHLRVSTFYEKDGLPGQARQRPRWNTRRKFAGKPRDHGRVRAGPAHDRKAVTADLDLDRRHGRAVVRAGGYTALAGGVGIFGHHRDPRRCRRIVVGKHRSGAARRAHAPDDAEGSAGRRQEIHAGVRLRRPDLVPRDRAR